MSKAIIATLKQDFTHAYALFEKALDFSVLAGVCLSIAGAYSQVVGDLLSTCLNGPVSQAASLRVGILIVKKYTSKQGQISLNFEDSSKDRDLLVKELRKESPMLAVDDLICIAIYVLMFIAITVYCRFCKIKAVETVSGLTLFSVMFWLFCFSDAFVK